MQSDRSCDVCKRRSEGLELASSRMAPNTYLICKNCSERGAESIGIVETWLALNGGADKPPDFCTDLVSYFDGEYRGWAQIRGHYLQNEQEILNWIDEEYELVDDLERKAE